MTLCGQMFHWVGFIDCCQQGDFCRAISYGLVIYKTGLSELLLCIIVLVFSFIFIFLICYGVGGCLLGFVLILSIFNFKVSAYHINKN